MRDRFHLVPTALLCLALFAWSAIPVLARQDGVEPPAGAAPPAESTEATRRPPAPQTVHERLLPNSVRVLVQPIEGASHAAIIALLEVGSSHDPSDSPGMSRLFDRLLMTCPSQDTPARTVRDLSENYPDGWNIHSYDTISVYGVVVPSDRVGDEVERLATRLRTLQITADDIARETASIEAEMKDLFDDRPMIKPMSWLVAKAFRHEVDLPRGIDPARLARLNPDQVMLEWQKRIVGGNVTLVLVGDVSRIGLDAITDKAFGTLASGPRPDFPLTVHPVGQVTRDIMQSSGLPGGQHHGTAAFYAPPITDPDHPAFLVLTNALMRDAAGMPGAAARLEFQYDMLLDPRAAYLTPQAWRYPKGPAQALGYWDSKIKNRKYTHADALRTLGALDWQLGAPLRGKVVDQLATQPGLLYTIGYATAYRAAFGDSAFWDDYRQRIERMDAKTLDAARQKYFADTNRAIFILKGD